MVSVCDDCTKKSICKPSKPYNFMCQWKNVEGKQRIAARDEWGLTAISNKFVPENRDEGWIALYWTIDDVDEAACMAEMGFEPKLTHEEKMLVLEKALKHHDADEGVTWYTLQYWLDKLYGDREYHLEEEDEE